MTQVVGTELAVYKTLLSEAVIRQANSMFGLNLKAWNVGGGQEAEMLYVYLDSPKRIWLDAWLKGQGISPDDYFSRMRVNAMKVSGSPIGPSMVIDHMTKLESINAKFILNQEGMATVQIHPPYQQRYRGEELLICHHLEYACLIMETLNVLESFGFDVSKEEDALRMVLAYGQVHLADDLLGKFGIVCFNGYDGPVEGWQRTEDADLYYRVRHVGQYETGHAVVFSKTRIKPLGASMSEAKKKIRQAFRDAVFGRDGYVCKKCGKKSNLDAHHITDRDEMPNGGYVPENGISLCEQCHLKAEVWNRSQGGAYVIGFRPEELYEIIESSLDQALEADSHATAPSS